MKKKLGLVLGVAVIFEMMSFFKNSVMAVENDIIPNYPSEVFSNSDGSILNLGSDTLTIGGIFSALLPYIYAVAGLILLFMLIAGGLGLMTAAGDPKKVEASQGRITAALIGFLIVFISYFVVQLVEMMLNVQIL